MSRLSKEKEDVPIKMLLLGESGAGKTGAFVRLAEKYRLIVLDYDGGFEDSWGINWLRINKPEWLDNIYFASLRDKTKLQAGRLVPDGAPTAWSKGMQLLTHWKMGSEAEGNLEDLGSSDNWGTDTIVVEDSLSFMSKAAFRYMDAVTSYKDGRQTYFEAQKQVDSMIQLVCSPYMKCHVILTAHFTLVDMESGLSKLYPATIGKALSPEIPKHFNTMLEVRSKIVEGKARRVIRTEPSTMLDTKHSVAAGLPAELSIDTGLMTIFEASISGQKPKQKASEMVATATA